MTMILQLIGYLGSILILLSFIFVTRGKWSPKSRIYLFSNLIGALFLAIYQVTLDAYAGVMLNVVFAGVELVNLWQYWNTKPRSKRKHRS